MSKGIFLKYIVCLAFLPDCVCKSYRDPAVGEAHHIQGDAEGEQGKPDAPGSDEDPRSVGAGDACVEGEQGAAEEFCFGCVGPVAVEQDLRRRHGELLQVVGGEQGGAGESLRALEHATGERIDRKRRVAELLEQVGLPASFAIRYPHELSGGQLQRVCIARALAIRPRIILLDEAISSLDASTQVQVMDLLADLRRELSLSYLFITHDLTSITYLCDRVIFMNQGEIVEQVDDISKIAAISSPYARQLLEAVMGIGCEHGSGSETEEPGPDASVAA